MPDATTAQEFGNHRFVLVCEDSPERQAVIKAALDQLGFTMYAAKNTEDALERLRRDTFEVAIVDEQFQGGSALDNDVLQALQLLPMSVRRYMFVALLGRTYKTFDNMLAFSRSVNVVVNLNDLPHLPAILRKGITENNEFYRVFREILTEVGKR
jgi:response regulator RpfG family c-di-GMP phosphodiesterase